MNCRYQRAGTRSAQDDLHDSQEADSQTRPERQASSRRRVADITSASRVELRAQGQVHSVKQLHKNSLSTRELRRVGRRLG